jgi:hypothetical protein
MHERGHFVLLVSVFIVRAPIDQFPRQVVYRLEAVLLDSLVLQIVRLDFTPIFPKLYFHLLLSQLLYHLL